MMTARELVAAALQRHPASRQEFLRDACVGSESLLAEALALLQAHDAGRTMTTTAQPGNPP